MKLNLSVDFLITITTVILSILVYVDYCSARLKPLASTASLSKVGNLAADHLSALQQTSRKVTKSSVVGINWKNVLLLAGLKAGLVGAGLIKKKVAYKKLKSLKGLKGIEGFDYLNGYQGYLNGGGYPNPIFNGKFNKFTNMPSYYEPQSTGFTNDWSKLLPNKNIENYSNNIEQQPIIYRKSSVCTDTNHCADYLTSSSITYQLLGTSLPTHLPILLPSTTYTSSATKISSSNQQQPFVITWVKTPSELTGNNANQPNLSFNTKTASTNPSNINHPTANNKLVQEKDDDKYHFETIPVDQQQIVEQNIHQNIQENIKYQQQNIQKLNNLNNLNDQPTNYLPTYTNTSQFNSLKDAFQFTKDNLQFKELETPSEQSPLENSNKIVSCFRPDNTDHIIDVNRNRNNPFEYDQVNIICPYSPNKGTRTDQTETYIIYNVSKDEYDQCRINSSSAKVIAVCNKPHQMMYFTITFRSFTPQPGGLEFHPGKDYYFISTSTGSPDGLERKVGGRCSSHHMKLTFKVCCGENGNQASNNRNNIQTIRPIDKQDPTPSSVDRLTNNLDDSSQSMDSNPIQSSDNQILSNGQHNLGSSQYEQTDKPPALKNILNNGVSSLLNKNNFNRINYISSTAIPSVPVSTPYWWRPHLSKLPTLKHQTGLLQPSSEIGSPSGSHNLNNFNNQFTLNSINNQQQPGNNKSDVWVVVTGGCVAVVVAFLIVGSLFACTNYLFFPKRKPSSPCTTLQTQTLHSPAFAQQYTLHAQHHFEYPMQHTIIK